LPGTQTISATCHLALRPLKQHFLLDTSVLSTVEMLHEFALYLMKFSSSYVDITRSRTNNLLNIWSGQLVFYRCSVIVLWLNKLETVLKCL